MEETRQETAEVENSEEQESPVTKERLIAQCAYIIEELQNKYLPNREMSLAITKLQEAGMWMIHIDDKQYDKVLNPGK